MEAVAATAARSDEAVDAPSAMTFRALYEPHVAGVYDFVLRLVRDPSLAADVVRRTFATARDGYREQGNDVPEWLYGVARDQAAEALRYRTGRNGAHEREGLVFTRVDPNRSPDPSVQFDGEFVELVWDAASELSLDDYALLALHVRHGVAPTNGMALRVARLRESFDERVTTELVARRGRASCAELEALLSRGGAVQYHIRGCTPCRESMRRFASPTDVLAALAPMRPGRQLEADLLHAFGRRRRRFGIL